MALREVFATAGGDSGIACEGAPPAAIIAECVYAYVCCTRAPIACACDIDGGTLGHHGGHELVLIGLELDQSLSLHCL